MMTGDSRTKFYRDKANAKIGGVCAGIADYTGVDVLWVRIGAVLLTLFGLAPWTFIAYGLAWWLAAVRPSALYADDQEARFWQGVRTNPRRSAREVKGKFRELDRRLADIEMYYTSQNKRLADEIDSLR